MSRRAFVLLCTLALLQMASAILNIDSVRALSAATTASPLPKVFTSTEDLEAFSSDYRVQYVDARGRQGVLTLDARQTNRLRGPYNRRNPYGAVLAFAPVLSANPHTQAMFRSVATHALCAEAPLLQELGLGVEAPIRSFDIVHTPRRGSHTRLPLKVSLSCP